MSMLTLLGADSVAGVTAPISYDGAGNVYGSAALTLVLPGATIAPGGDLLDLVSAGLVAVGPLPAPPVLTDVQIIVSITDLMGINRAFGIVMLDQFSEEFAGATYLPEFVAGDNLIVYGDLDIDTADGRIISTAGGNTYFVSIRLNIAND